MPTLDAAASMLPIDQAINATGTVGVVAEGAAMTLDVADHLQGRSGRRSVLGRLIRGGDNSNKPTATPHPFEPRRTGQAVEPAGPAVRFAAHHFKDSVPNLPATTPDNRDRTKGVTPPETVEFNKELVDGFRGFTESYVKRLIDMETRTIDVGGRRVTVYERMKQLQRQSGQNYAEDDFMLDVFAPTNPQTGTRTLKSAAEINALITEHPQMIQNLMIIAERYARDALATAGLRAEMRGSGHRTNVNNLAMVIDTHVDQGAINALGRRVVDWLANPLNRNGRGNNSMTGIDALTATVPPGSAVGATAGAVVGGPIGALVGGSAGIVLGPIIAAGADRLFRGGIQLALVHDGEVLTQARSDGEQMRGSYLIGVDSRTPLTSTRLGAAMQEAIQIVYMRAEYMRALGVPPQNLDALSEQFLNVHNQRPEETDESARNEIMHRFEELGGRTAGTTLEQQRNIFRRAQEQAIVHRFEQFRAKASQPTVNEVQRLTQAIAARQEGGTALAARTQEASQALARLQEDRASLEGSGTALASYRNRVDEIQGQRTVLGRTLGGIRAGVTTYATTEDASDAIREVISNPTAPAITIVLENGRTLNIQNIPAREDTVSNNRQTEYNRISGMTPNPGESADQFAARQTAARQIADTTYERSMIPVNRDREQLENAITRLRSLGDNLRNLEEQALSSTEVTSGLQEIAKFTSAETTLTGFGVAQTTIDTGNYAAILTEVHNAYIANQVNGWPDTEDNLPEHRLLVRQAIALARARTLERAGVANPGVVEPHYQNAIALGLTTDQLRMLSVDELGRRSATLNPAGTPIPRAELENAQLWAREQLRYLQEAIQQENRILQGLETSQDRAIRNVNPENEIAQLNMVLEMNSGRDQIHARASQAWVTPERRANLENVNLINPATATAEGHTEAEANSGIPRNVLEILNILTGYQDDPDRSGRFQQILRNLGPNPNLLVGMLNNAFDDRLVPRAMGTPAPAPIDEFSTRFRESVRAHAITGASFGRGASRMINGFNAWSKTI